MTVSVRARGAASVLAFSHLLGFGKPAKSSAKAEDDDRKDDPDAEDGDEEETDEKKDSNKSKKAKADDDKTDDPDAEDGDEDETDNDKKDSRKSKKAKADDDKKEDPDAEDGDEDEDMASAARSGRSAERARWAKVLSNPAAGSGRVGIACNLLSTTSMSGAAIISALEEIPAGDPARGGRRSLDDRMEAEKPANPGADARAPKPGTAAAQAAAIVAAGKKRRGEI